MNKCGIGVGSASIVLVFAVLCLTVFTLITYIVSGNSKALVDAEAKLVVGYYKADALAEQILAELLESDYIPATIQGVEMQIEYDFYLDSNTVYFACPIGDTEKQLHVHVSIVGNSYSILSWRMGDESEWLIDDGLSVWID